MREWAWERSVWFRWVLVLMRALITIVLLTSGRTALAQCTYGETISQRPGSLSVNVRAAFPNELTGSWTTTNDSTAFAGKKLKAGVPGSTDLSTYSVEFRRAGSYKLYIRARGPNGSSNSIYVPSGGNVEGAPDTSFDFSSDNTWTWSSESSLPLFEVTEAMLGRPLRFRLRTREQNAELDLLLFALTNVSASESIASETEDFIYKSGVRPWGSPQGSALAHNRSVLKAPSNAVSSQFNGIAAYEARFKGTNATYFVYVRGRGFGSNQKRVVLPTALQANPTTIVELSADQSWGWSAPSSLAVDVPLGGPREFRIGVADPNVEIDSIVIAPTTKTPLELDAISGYLEAEGATLNGVTSVADGAASGGQRVRLFTEIGDSLTFSGVPTTNELSIRYSLATSQARQASVYVNGTDVETVVFTTTGSWTSYATTTLRGSFAGSVSLRIDPDDHVANEADSSASIDRVSIGDAGRKCLVASKAQWDSAMNWAMPGDSVVVAAGGIMGRHTFSVPGTTNGTGDRPIVIRSEFPGEPTFDDAAAIPVYGSHVTLSDLVFTGGAFDILEACDVEDNDPDHEPWADDTGIPIAVHCRGISLYGSNDRVTNVLFDHYYATAGSFVLVGAYGPLARVDHTAFNAQAGSGPSVHAMGPLGSEYYPHFDRNYFGNRAPVDQNGSEMMRLGKGRSTQCISLRATVSESFFENFSYPCPDSEPCGDEREIISVKTSHNRLLHNRFVNAQRDLTLRNGSNTLVFGNRFEENGSIRVYGADQKVLNNEFDYLSGWEQPAILIANGTDPVPAEPGGSVWCEGGPDRERVEDLVIAFNSFFSTQLPLAVDDPSSAHLLPTSVVVANNLCTDGGCRVEYRPGNDAAGQPYPESALAGVFTYSKNYFWNGTYRFNGGAAVPLHSFSSGFVTNQAAGGQDLADPNHLYGIVTDVRGQSRTEPYDVGANEAPATTDYIPDLADVTGPTWWNGP